jgi:hypothetical protein
MSQAEIVGSEPAYIVSSVEIEREVPDWLKYAYKNAESIQRVRELHEECKICECNDCRLCDEPFPCETIQALDGETE